MSSEEPPPEVVQAARDAFAARGRLPVFAMFITLENAAFHNDEGELEPGPELARILRALAGRIEAGHSAEGGPVPLLDANGNSVGSWWFGLP